MGDKRESFDVTIIGGGAGGYTAAQEAISKGFKVALIEKERVGGTCLNRGCVPTQCLLRDLIEYSFFVSSECIEKELTGTRINLQKVMERKNHVVDLLVSGTENTLLSGGVAVFQGEGTFMDAQTVRVRPSETVIQSKFIIIATGARYRLKPPLEFDHQYIWDTTDALHMESVPENIAIVGGGHRAMTFADIFHYLGSQVHVLTEASKILPDQDREITSRYRRVLKEKKVQLLTNVRVTGVEIERKRDTVDLNIESKKGPVSLKVSKVLVPGDREANAQGLNLGKTGLSLKDGLIPVDSHLMTPVPHIYAIGDVIGGKYVAHKAMEEGIAVVGRLAGETPKIDYGLIPSCLYTNPEVASIGLTEEEARRGSQDIEVGYFPFPAGTRPSILGLTEGINKVGIIKVVFEKKYGEVLGVHIIGPQATELISLASMAMKNQLGLQEIKEVVYPHPSFAENFLDAINDALSR